MSCPRPRRTGRGISMARGVIFRRPEVGEADGLGGRGSEGKGGQPAGGHGGSGGEPVDRKSVV